MKAKLTGKIVGYDGIAHEGYHKLTINFSGNDAFGKPISGQMTINCTSAVIKNLKLQEFLMIDIDTKKE